jgi:uncharacterized protein YbaA (DUF1428 family)
MSALQSYNRFNLADDNCWAIDDGLSLRIAAKIPATEDIGPRFMKVHNYVYDRLNRSHKAITDAFYAYEIDVFEAEARFLSHDRRYADFARRETLLEGEKFGLNRSERYDWCKQLQESRKNRKIIEMARESDERARKVVPIRPELTKAQQDLAAAKPYTTPPQPPGPSRAVSEEDNQVDAKALPLIYFSETRGRKRSKYIVRDLLAEGATSTVYGAPKTNKTTSVVDIGVHVAAGKDWRGKRIKEPRGVVYFAFERSDQVLKALEAYQVRDGLKDLPFAVVPRLVDMLDPSCVGIISETIAAAEAKFGIPVGLVVFDTWNKGIAAGGGNEDKAEHQNRAAANLRRLIELRPVLHCMTIGHSGKDTTKGERGSNATQGDRDVGVLIEAFGEKRVMSIAYANELPDGQLTAFKCQVVELDRDDEGEQITGFIVDPEELSMDAVSKQAKVKPLNDKQKLGFQALIDAIRKTNRPDSKTTYTEWREAMFKNGALVVDDANPRTTHERIAQALQIRGMIKHTDEWIWVTNLHPTSTSMS